MSSHHSQHQAVVVVVNNKNNMKKSTEHMEQLLIRLNACSAAKEWSKGKTFEEVLNTCHRGDWLLWLFVRTNPADRRLLFLAKGMCAETVIHLMKDKRSIDAVNAAKNYGLGLINEEELKVFAAAAAFYYADDDADSAAYAAADDDADSAAYAAYAAAYAAADSDSAAAANRMKTADICRSLFKIELWNI